MLTVTYSFYTDTYHGKLSSTDFARASVFAAAYIDELTLGRTGDGTGLSADALLRAQLAFCSVCDVHALQEDRVGIASANNDGYSETYQTDAGAAGRQLRNAAEIYLAPTGMLYRGVG